MTRPNLALDAPSIRDEPQDLPMHGQWVIGSDPKRADLCIDDPDVEGVHCVLHIHKDGSLEAQDMGTVKGTLHNESPLGRATMCAGDFLDFGATRVWIVDLANPAQMANPHLPAVSGFRLERELGRGEGGTVYLAVQESLQREVALKVLAPSLAHDPAVVEQFQKEARAAAALGHNNVVTVFDVGSEGDTHYLSMEYMAAGSLEDRIHERGAQPWSFVLKVLADGAQALQFAEGRSLVHRDIKPANLMIHESGTVKLADLGLVLDLSESEGSGPIKGTPHFMAPELIRGSAPSALSDLYSLGASAYQLIAGKTPFQGAHTKQILREVLQTEPQTLHALDSDVPEGVSALVASLMAKDPSMRPNGAGELLRQVQALRMALQSDKTSASERKSPVIGMALVGALALAIGAYVWFSTDTVEDKPSTTGAQAVSRTGGSTNTAENPTDQSALSFETDGGESQSEAAEGELGDAFEAEAKLAFEALGDQVITEEERIQQLRELAQTYRGSTIADQALAKAGGLEEKSRAATRELEERAIQLEAEQTRLGTVSKWSPGTGNPLVVVSQIIEFQPLLHESFAADFEEKRVSAIDALWVSGDRFLLTRLASHAAQLEQGQFAQVRADLEALKARFLASRNYVLPESLRPVDGSQALLEFKARIAEIDVALDELPEKRTLWAQKMEQLDRDTFGAQIGRFSELREELARLDTAALAVRLEEVITTLNTEAARGWATSLLRDVQAVEVLKTGLIQGFKEGEWKKTTTLDPREPRPKNVPVTGTAPEWVSVDGERLHWGHFLKKKVYLKSMFEERLQRPYTDLEQEGLAALFRLQAILDYFGQVEEMLYAQSPARFTTGEFDTAMQTLEAVPGQFGPDADAAMQKEIRVAFPLGQALRALSDGLPGAAAGYLERTVQVGHGTWLLALLSDGSSLQFPIPDPIQAPSPPESLIPKEGTGPVNSEPGGTESPGDSQGE